jgi:hypothetical protein
MKNIYKRNELSCADFIMSFQQGLLDDFLQHQKSLESPEHQDFILNYSKCRPDIPVEVLEKVFSTKKNNKWVSDADLMTGIGIKYDFRHVPESWEPPENLKTFYSSAVKLTDHYGDLCPNAGYSILPANSIFGTHTDTEMKDRKFIRIHIPLIIPPGEIFLQVDQEKVYWTDIFAFNGQVPHSAHNLSNEWRLIFLMDLDYTAAGIL